MYKVAPANDGKHPRDFDGWAEVSVRVRQFTVARTEKTVLRPTWRSVSKIVLATLSTECQESTNSVPTECSFSHTYIYIYT